MNKKDIRYSFLIIIILGIVLVPAQRPVPRNTFYRIQAEEEKQFHPRNLPFGIGLGRFHSEMDSGPVLVFNDTAYCAAGHRNPVVQSRVLLRTDELMGFHRAPVTSHLYSFERPREQVTLLSPYLEELLEEYGDFLFFAQARTDILPIYDPDPYNPLGYIERTLTAAQNILMAGYFTGDMQDPFHLGWISYQELEDLDIEMVPRLLDHPFPLFQFSLPDFYVYKFEARIYPVQEIDEFPFFHEFDLFNLREFEDKMFFDIRYATGDNFTGEKVYPYPFAYLQEEAAMALERVNDSLREKGYALIVMDAYRPLTVQYRFWDILPDSRYVANPATGSRHNRGVSVDIMLATLDGDPVEMPSEYDDFSERAHVDFEDCSEEAIQNRDMLINAMRREGFRVLSTEWWHYDYEDFTRYPVTDFIPEREEYNPVRQSSAAETEPEEIEALCH